MKTDIPHVPSKKSLLFNDLLAKPECRDYPSLLEWQEALHVETDVVTQGATLRSFEVLWPGQHLGNLGDWVNLR